MSTSLERATPGFRRGYNDGIHNRKPVYVVDSGPHGDFYTNDYVEGFAAARNDQYWHAVADNNALDTIERRRAARLRHEMACISGKTYDTWQRELELEAALKIAPADRTSWQQLIVNHAKKDAR